MGPGGHDGFIEGAMTTMLVFKRLAALAATIGAILAGAGIALAGDGQPSPWQLGFQQSATPVMDSIVWFHDLLLYVIIAITLFVLALLVIVMVRFNARANPTPSRTTHNTLLEVAWTLIPVVILVVIAIPSFRLLFYQLNIPAMSAEARRRHDQGDRQAVVLELQLSRPRQFRVRLAAWSAIAARKLKASRGCWRSTTRWSCR